VDVCPPVADVSGVAVKKEDGRNFGDKFSWNTWALDQEQVDASRILKFKNVVWTSQ